MSVTPDFIGQIYKDTATGNLWRANSLAAGDWTLESQYMGITWTPRSQNLSALTQIGVDGFGTGVTAFAFDGTSNDDTIYIAFSGVSSASFPNMVTARSLNIASNSSLTSLSLPSLVTIKSLCNLQSNSSLASVSLPSLTTYDDEDATDFTINSSAALTSISFPLFVPSNGSNFVFNLNALTDASVNHILSRFVANAGYTSGTILLNGGTNAPPSGQGIADKATLIGRGCTVTTN